ncbi:MAG: multiple antibiotic resistance protein marC [Thermoplasmatales archaeon A-plasma]|jgi:multiple antibiotic resistance protein|nr:MAG: multiple antibiotic resistance protein marC [Thermoplasmatales archaeon A-plasma]WMT43890.1 MAG: MarC family protein [Cuniculiplasma divulgatum]
MTLLLLNLIVFYLSIVATVFAILNPIGAVPTLMVLTDGYTASEKKRVIFKSIMVASGMILGFMFLGIYIFLVLGIDISDFKVAGGILLFKVAFDMLQGKVSNTKLTPQETQESIDREAVGIVPIGTPLLAGPGTITTAMIYFNSPQYFISERIAVILAVITVLLISYIVLRLSNPLFNRLGKTGALIISRIMGLLLASIAIEFITSGLFTIIHTL